MEAKKRLKKNKVAKVPVVLQLEKMDCGAACLSMISAYYGRWVSLEQARSDCGVSRDGVSAKSIVLAARSYGFEAKGYSLEPEVLSKRVTFPCIIHYQMSHYVVLCGFKNDHAIIVNPARGEEKVPFDVFKKLFTGICLEIVPGADFVPSGEKRSLFSFAKKRLCGMGVVAALIMAAMAVNSFFGFINPYMSGVFLDRILSGKDPKYLHTFIIIMFALALVQVIVALTQNLYRLKLEGRLSKDGNSDFVKKLLSVPQEFFSRRMAGDLIIRKEKNAAISMSLVAVIAPLFIQSVMMVFFLVVMIKESLVLTAVGLLTVVINLFMARLITQKRMDFSRRHLSDTGRLTSNTLSGIGMMESIYASGAEDGYFQTWRGYQALKNSGRVAFLTQSSYLDVIPGFLSAASGYVVMLIAVFLTMEGKFSLGLMTAFLGYLSSFMTPADTLISSGQRISEMRTDMERITDVMEYEKDELSAALGAGALRLFGMISIKDVSFSYAKFDKPVLKDISLNISPGESVAIVGHSGSGKTSLLRLLTGLYQPTSGRIMYDGKSIKEIGHESFTRSVAVVDQDISFFGDTIKNNLKMWDECISDEDMINACKDACIYDDIIRREGGFDSVLSQGGADLSGGQRQRLDIARALCKNPAVLILDEATASLDVKIEREVLSAIRRRGITCIMVTHRLSAISDCDNIIVMDAGCIVASGRHDELYENNALYKMLVTNE